MNVVFDFHFNMVQEPAGDILVFLTGQDDIDAAVKLLREDTQDDRRRTSGRFVSSLNHIFTFILF